MSAACPSLAVPRNEAIEKVRAVLSDWRGRNGIVVFGAGAHTHKILPALEEYAGCIAAIVDDSPQVWGRRVGRWRVRRPEEALSADACGILVSSDIGQETMAARLAARYGDRFAVLTLYDSLRASDAGPVLRETGERQTGRALEQIDLGHRARYYWALQHLQAGASVLDAACGNGYGSSILADGGANVLGIDVCEDAIRFARYHYASDGITWRADDLDGGAISRLARDGVSFDAVVSFETLEHLSEPQQFIEAAFRILRPGGAIFCSTPNARMMSLEEAPFHRNHFETDDVIRMLSDAGFESTRWFGQEGMEILQGRFTTRQRYVLYQGERSFAK